MPTGALVEAQQKLVRLDREADEAADAAVPANTRRAYEFELACFVSWCARHGVRPMPAEPKVIRVYLHELAGQGRDARDLSKGRPKGTLGYSALMRALAAICRSHADAGHLSPWKDPLIKKERATLAITKGVAPKKQKRGLESVGENLLFRVCDKMGDDVRGVRDRAMILVGWQGGGRRRSEIAAARVEHFKSVEGGIVWRIPRSKADQIGKGLEVALTPEDDERYCPVRCLRRWLDLAKIEQGPVFRGVDMMTGAILEVSLAPQGVSRRVQHYVKLLGLDPSDFGGHSLRSGFATSAVKLGKKVPDIMAATGHHSVEEFLKYVRRANLVEESAGRGLIGDGLARRSEKLEEK